MKVAWTEWSAEILGLRIHTQLWSRGCRRHTLGIVGWDMMTSTTGAWVKCQRTEGQLGVVHLHGWKAWIRGVEAHKSRFRHHPQEPEMGMAAMTPDMIQAMMICTTEFLVLVTGMTQAAALVIQIEVQHFHQRTSAMSAPSEGVQGVEMLGVAWD